MYEFEIKFPTCLGFDVSEEVVRLGILILSARIQVPNKFKI